MFDRTRLKIKRLGERESKSDLSILVNPESDPPNISDAQRAKLKDIALNVMGARDRGAPVIYAFGAHLIKNGMSKVLIELMRRGYVQHLLSNEAVVIHDWELAFQGKTEEDVKRYVAEGQFGLWETGEHIGKALKRGAAEGLGYGESVGKSIFESNYPNKEISVLSEAYRLKIPFSVGVTIGQNIIHAHPEFDFAIAGETGGKDFLNFVESIEHLQGGVYFSIGSAILSPQIFEKSLSMGKNVNRDLKDYSIYVNDIESGSWDWSKGEPPKDNPEYYSRFMKTFSRMGGKSEYIRMDNRAFLHNLYSLLKKD